MDEYELFEAKCKKLREENNKLLTQFDNYLSSRKLSAKTINKHVSNIEFYINDFLLYEEPQNPKEGVSQLNYFLGDWFIRKAMWASVTSIKEYIASLKHFYSFMHKKDKISLNELVEMKEEIKESKSEWLEAIRKYDDQSINLESIW